MTLARLCACGALGLCVPVLVASLALGVWLAATDESTAGEIVVLCTAAIAALVGPFLLAFSVAYQGQVSAMQMHAKELQLAMKASAPS